MSNLASLLVMSALTATSGQTAPSPVQPPSGTATVTFVSDVDVLAGIVHGIDGVDSEPGVYGQRLSTQVQPGVRTVWYSCPNEPRLKDGSRVTYDFVAGRNYQLACRAGQDAVIRPVDEC